MNKTPIGENMKKRSFYGPSWCVLCHLAEESNEHLFLICPAAVNLGEHVLSSLAIT